MAVVIRWTKIALTDLEYTFAFISLNNPTAARNVIQQILKAIERLEAFPEAGRPGRVKGTRELVIGSLPYVIIYRLTDSSLEILAVLHSSRKWV